MWLIVRQCCHFWPITIFGPSPPPLFFYSEPPSLFYCLLIFRLSVRPPPPFIKTPSPLLFGTGEYINFPQNQDQIQSQITNFGETNQIPQIVGVVNGSYIPFIAPGESKEDYFNGKHAYSVNLLGVVDINMLFLHASIVYRNTHGQETKSF